MEPDPSKPPIDKSALVARLRARLAESLEGVTASQKAAQSGAVHSEARQEHAKDMRSTEASYVARGLAERVETLKEAVAALALLKPREFGPDDVVGLGALVGLRDEEDREFVYFVAPVGGGERLDLEGVPILVLTPHSPLGASLVGSRVDEELEVALPGGRRTAVVTWVR